MISTKNHHFFPLELSPWPILISLNSFNFFISLSFFLKSTHTWPLLVSLVILSFSSFLWWTNYSKEFNLEGKMSSDLESGLKFSMLLFISSEIFFFFSFFWSYFHFFLSPCLETSLSWPVEYSKMFDYSNVPMVNTIVLLTSGVTITMSHYYLIYKNYSSSVLFSTLTVLLGGGFTLLQLQEYGASFFCISDGSFGTSFFMLTGFHGIHVLIGSLFILVNLLYFYKFSFTKNSVLSFELASWYWHFVDVVWIFLFFFLYYINC